METTTALLELVRGGDLGARDRLIARYLPILRRWAHGRLPQRARDLAETDDLVQITLIRAIDRLDHFEVRHEGAFLAYLRRILLNAVRDEARRAARRPGQAPLPETLAAELPSAVESAIGRQRMERYEAALHSLPEVQQQAVILRLEFGYTFPEIAVALGRPSANAVRMMVARALLRLGEAMHD